MTPSKIKSLEDRIGGKLPKAYRDFLLQHNGGEPEPATFCKKGKRFSSLDMFFGLGIKDRFWDLRTQYGKARQDMPKEVLPIGLDVFGNKVCLAFKGKNRGKVYFWAHEGAPEPSNIAARYPGIDWGEYSDDEPRPRRESDWPGHPDLTLLADSFEKFLDSFTADE